MNRAPVPRHHYNPTPAQRVELAAAALLLRIQSRDRRRRLEQAEAAFKRMAWSDSAAAELAQIHVRRA